MSFLSGPKVKTPAPPKVARLPREQDTTVEAAKQRQVADMKRRSGYESTQLTSNTIAGSSGQKLGA